MTVDNDGDNDGEHPEARNPPSADHNHLRQPPTHVEHFGGHAGTPVSSPTVGTATGYAAYSQKVDETQANPWAPFTSRVDWEVARWAKLRGSGSTAFSDLLAIEGVCFLPVSVITSNHLILFSRSSRLSNCHTRIQLNSIKSSTMSFLLKDPHLPVKKP